MSSEPKSLIAVDSEAASADEQFRRDRRKLFADALVGVPIILTLTSKPLYAVVNANFSDCTARRYMLDQNVEQC